MKTKITLKELHLLLTYQCTFECDHCFVWGSPWQNGTMTSEDIRNIIDQAREAETIEWIYFEGGEPFLYYPVMLEGVNYAHKHGFNIGIVTNGYWANDLQDTILWLRPLAGKIHVLSVSSDLFHYDEKISQQSNYILEACRALQIPTGIISITNPNEENTSESSLMYRGRASDKLAAGHENKSYLDLTECPYEDLRNPGRFHLDPLGYLHICQGIVAGNIYQDRLQKIFTSYDPLEHPIVSLLIHGGPLKLARDYDISTRPTYADACQMCYEVRASIRGQNNRSNMFLQPDQVYGIY